MSMWIQELKEMKGLALWLVILYLAVMIGTIMMADHPLNLYFLNEVFMLPVIVLVTTLFFGREFAGTFPEILVTYPLSLATLLMRKFLMIFSVTILLHLCWSLVYLMKFGQMKTLIFPFSNASPMDQKVSWSRLFIQAMPEYWLFICLTIAGIIVSKKVYGGVIISFAYWLFELLTVGSITNDYTLFTAYLLGGEGSFLHNRLLLTMIASGLLIVAIITFNHRSRWIVNEEPE